MSLRRENEEDKDRLRQALVEFTQANENGIGSPGGSADGIELTFTNSDIFLRVPPSFFNEKADGLRVGVEALADALTAKHTLASMRYGAPSRASAQTVRWRAPAAHGPRARCLVRSAGWSIRSLMARRRTRCDRSRRVILRSRSPHERLAIRIRLSVRRIL